MPGPHDDAHGPGAPIDAWLIPPDNPPQRVADKRRQPMRLSALFEEFVTFLRVEQEAAPRSIETYRWCFGDFLACIMQEVGGTVLVTHFTAERCRTYQYALATRGLQANSIRVRLATLGSFGKWAVRREKLDRNPLDLLTRPRRKARLPRVPRWDTIERLLAESTDPRERAIVALMAYGGLRRSEVVALDMGDYAPEFGLRRVQGKGGIETAVPLPEVARVILADYFAKERAGVASTEPIFVVRYRTRGGVTQERRMTGQRVWKLIKALGRRAGLPELHPHAFRHGCGVELHRRTGGNLRLVQEHLRHADIQTTTIYTRVTQHELQQAVSVFDKPGS
jgi:integrase/recombinase XerC